MRVLITIHRYVGIAVGWLIVLWCVSGVVMIYVPYPEATLDEHTEALELLDLGNCCAIDPAHEWLLESEARDFSIEMRQGRPVLSLPDGFGDSLQVALDTGRILDEVSARQALDIAATRTAHWPERADVRYMGEIARDQWTVEYFRPDRRLHHLALGDAAGTEWYLDSRNGQLVQVTTAAERGWNRVGAVVHWLYPTVLRSHGPIWANTVIWSTIVALFLTVLGIGIGVAKIRLGANAKFSPYRGLALWHHMLGLAFGLLTLTWLLSGLLSMNPWGLLAGSGSRMELERLEGDVPTVSRLVDTLKRVADRELPEGTTYLTAAPLLGELYVIAHDRDDRRRRLAADTLSPAPLETEDLEAAAATLLPDAPVASAELIFEPDAYYYDHKVARQWPVFRVCYDDAERTRYYIDPETGELLGRMDSTSRAYRWLFTALHRLDFASIVRVRPLWDTLMIVLLAGVAAVSGAGTWLGLRYLRRMTSRRRGASAGDFG